MKLLKLCLFPLLLISNITLAQDDALVSRGLSVFERYCILCHGAGPGDDGAPMLPGTHALYIKYRGERAALLENRADINIEFVKTIVRNGIASMPPFRKTEVTDEDLEAIVAYFDSVPDE